MFCFSKRYRLVGSCISTLVSNTTSLVRVAAFLGMSISLLRRTRMHSSYLTPESACPLKNYTQAFVGPRECDSVILSRMFGSPARNDGRNMMWKPISATLPIRFGWVSGHSAIVLLLAWLWSQPLCDEVHEHNLLQVSPRAGFQ